MSAERGVQRFSLFLAACAGALVFVFGLASVLANFLGGFEADSPTGRVKLFLVASIIIAPGLWAVVRGLVWVRKGFEGVDSASSRKPYVR